jgi:hypothetical protein
MHLRWHVSFRAYLTGDYGVLLGKPEVRKFDLQILGEANVLQSDVAVAEILPVDEL